MDIPASHYSNAEAAVAEARSPGARAGLVQSAFLEVAGGAQRLQIPEIVGPAEENGVDVVDMIGAAAALLARPPVTEENLRPDVPPRPG